MILTCAGHVCLQGAPGPGFFFEYLVEVPVCRGIDAGWIVLGAIAGWLASLINGSNGSQSWIGNIVLGIVGALVGGFLWNLITGSGSAIHFSIGSLIIAVIGALIVSYLYSMVTGRRGV